MKWRSLGYSISCQSCIEQVLELVVVGLCVSDSGSSHDWSSSEGNLIMICNMRSLLLHILENVSHSWLNVEPSTSVLWLLLGPCDSGIAVLPEVRNEPLEWEWAQTLNSQNGNIVLSISSSLSLEVVVDLTGAKNDFPDFGWLNEILVLVWDHWPEPGLTCEILDV